MAASSESDSDWEDAEESAPREGCRCLFCSRELQRAGEILEHCTGEHGVDLLGIKAKLGLDFYSCVKLINYVRSEHPTPSQLLLTTSHPPYPWNRDQYFKPVLEEDPLLQYDFEGEGEGEGSSDGSHPQPCPQSATEQPSVSDQQSNLLQRLQESERKTEEYKTALARAVNDLENMRVAVKRLFSEEESSGGKPRPQKSGSHANRKRGVEEEEEEDEEDGYFSTYSHFAIHEEMLKDEVRTDSYQLFMKKNPEIFKDKVVLDIGCGTGILSMFAAQAGARRVIGVDQSNIIHKAMEIVRDNGFEDRITLIRGLVEEVELPVEKVDVIISEWMGYFLLFESMLGTVLLARDKWLKDPTCVYPNSCSLSVFAMGDKFERQSRVDFWNNVYGFNMACMKEGVFKEATVHQVDPYSIISSSDVIKKFDLSKVKHSELDFEAPFTLTMQQDTQCHALVGYFDIGFDAEQYSVHFSTSPQDPPTHWKQTVFYLKEPIPVHTGLLPRLYLRSDILHGCEMKSGQEAWERGDLLRGRISCKKNRRDPRSLDIVIQLEQSSFLPDVAPVKLEQKFVLQ